MFGLRKEPYTGLGRTQTLIRELILDSIFSPLAARFLKARGSESGKGNEAQAGREGESGREWEWEREKEWE